eukprot:TRINITY_DN5922_c0_g1_i2.p1 TRINITY_DN5922_c0_g1~~TRINITY_DN5922_c0_g1_i2.p1  ORF type:complete len:675 (+),score=119.62 TRINITY_DN5922_c0_g1_i2:111-2135(+)
MPGLVSPRARSGHRTASPVSPLMIPHQGTEGASLGSRGGSARKPHNSGLAASGHSDLPPSRQSTSLSETPMTPRKAAGASKPGGKKRGKGRKINHQQVRKAARAWLKRYETGQQAVLREILGGNKETAAHIVRLALTRFTRQEKRRIAQAKALATTLASAGAKRRRRLVPLIRLIQSFSRARLSLRITNSKRYLRGVSCTQRLTRGILARQRSHALQLNREELRMVLRRWALAAAVLRREEREAREAAVRDALRWLPRRQENAAPPVGQRPLLPPAPQELLLLRRAERTARQDTVRLRAGELRALAHALQRLLGALRKNSGASSAGTGVATIGTWSAVLGRVIVDAPQLGGAAALLLTNEARGRAQLSEDECEGWRRLGIAQLRAAPPPPVQHALTVAAPVAPARLPEDRPPAAAERDAPVPAAPPVAPPPGRRPPPDPAPRVPPARRCSDMRRALLAAPFSAALDRRPPPEPLADRAPALPPARPRRPRPPPAPVAAVQQRAAAWGVTPEGVQKALAPLPCVINFVRVGCGSARPRSKSPQAVAVAESPPSPQAGLAPCPPPRGDPLAPTPGVAAALHKDNLGREGAQGLLLHSPAAVLRLQKLQKDALLAGLTRPRTAPRRTLLCSPPARCVMAPPGPEGGQPWSPLRLPGCRSPEDEDGPRFAGRPLGCAS